MAPDPHRPRTTLLRALAAVFVAAAVALVAAAFYVLRLRCENFGCIGVGVAWLAWALCFGTLVVGGLVLQSAARRAQGPVRLIGGVLRLLVVLGLALAARWFWLAHSS